ncbi:hypothetical protein BDN67DRAFT_1014485 [Paxillus ammoniavirescens]|nr:hypothetical protein BDN67DRAFT_1014485 [Paxillus ammoniavirescens]
MDVDNSGDYKEMTKKINDERPAVVKIFIDMKDVEKLPWLPKFSSNPRFEPEPPN